MTQYAIDPVIANRVLLKRSLPRFVRQAWQVVEPGVELVWNWHIDDICRHLQAVTRAITNYRLPEDQREPGPEIFRLLINVPPGHMKSLLVNVFWFAWMWAKFPWLRGLFASHELGLAMRDSVRSRDIVMSDWYQDTFQPTWSMKSDQNVKGKFLNDEQGARLCGSVGGSVTGWRGDFWAVDDPINLIDSRSEVELEKAIWWIDKAMSSRLNNMQYGGRVMIMQRVHEDDPSGHVLRKKGLTRWTHLCMPSEFEIKTKCRIEVTGYEDPRKIEGELLFPGMFGKQVIAEAKEDLGSDAYAGQHQQRPAPSEGGFFKRKWFRYYRRVKLEDGRWQYILTDPIAGTTRRVMEEDCWTLITADTAMKEKTMNDYWVAGVWHIERVMDDKGYQRGCTMMLRHVWRERCTAPEGEARLMELYDRFKPNYIGIEDKVSGTAVIQRFVRDGLPVQAIKANTDKVTRASTAQVWEENGKVWRPLDAEWLESNQTEMLVFPNGSNDDQVDMESHAVNFANNRDLWIQPAPRKFAPGTLGAIDEYYED